jgi:LCP family protein required for cell wall assembly
MIMKRNDKRASEELSRQLNESQLGTHIVHNSERASNTHVNFGNQRRQSKANRGVVTHVTPNTRSRESQASYARRRRTPDYVLADIRKRRRRRRAVTVAVVIIAALVVWLVSSFVFSSSVDNKIKINDSQVTSALTAPSSSTDPYYVLVAGESMEEGKRYQGPRMLVLVRVDPQNKQVTYITLPWNTQATLADGNEHPLSQAQEEGGDAELISTVSDLTGVSIAHFVKFQNTSLAALVDAIGGVSVDLPESVDDPNAGTIYLDAGEQTLNGAQAATAAMASNYSDPLTVQSKVQSQILQALVASIEDKGGLSGGSPGRAGAEGAGSRVVPRRSALRGAPMGRGGRHLMPRPQGRQISPGAPSHARFFGGALDGARRARPPLHRSALGQGGLLLRPPARRWRVRVGAFWLRLRRVRCAPAGRGA